ncbi:MAG: hypothetical protein HY057_01780 [Rhodospirillales bacterium]|nr:hypothetical protein [Rhodospirillales bacterium]
MSVTEKFAVLRRATRVWAVGSIHGDAARLRAMHEALAARFDAGDRLVYLGNYLGVGAEIPATVDELLRFRREIIARPRMFASDVVYLRGGQEEMWQKLLQLHFAVNPREVLDWIVAQGVGATIVAYGGEPKKGFAAARDGAMSMARWAGALRQAMAARPGHQALLSALKRAAFTDNGKMLFVHAGLDPSRPLAAQSDSLWWGSAGFARMDSPYEGFGLVVRGFDRAASTGQPRTMARTPFALTLDAGCGFGGPLVAVCLSAEGETLELLEV